MTHPATVYSLSTRLLHWSMAFCFIGAIVLAYFVIWVLGHDHRSACRYSTCTGCWACWSACC